MISAYGTGKQRAFLSSQIVQQRMASSTQCSWVWVTPGDSEGQGTWCAAVHGVAKSWHDWVTEKPQ